MKGKKTETFIKGIIGLGGFLYFSKLGYSSFRVGASVGAVSASGIAPKYNPLLEGGSLAGGLILPPLIPIGIWLFHKRISPWVAKNNCSRPFTVNAVRILTTLGLGGGGLVGVMLLGICAGQQLMASTDPLQHKAKPSLEP